MQNRRNYYRILHVQPDAPAALIKSCYRALMHTLAMHPDRGGDHWNAALLNEAYAVLSCPQRRAEYDRAAGGPRRGPVCRPDAASTGTAVALAAGRGAADEFCAFCGWSHFRGAEQCARCDSPLALSTEWSGESSGRRARQRLALDREVALHSEWPLDRPRRARIRDLAPGGLRIELDDPLEVHRILKLESEMLRAVARVAHCRATADRSAACFVVGVEFFTLRLPQTSGVFLSVSG